MSAKKETENVSKLKRNYLKGKLKILGFNSMKDLNKSLDSFEGYFALRRIGNELEKEVSPKGSKAEKVKQYKQGIAEDSIFMKNQDEFFSKVREIYPDFGLHMREKISDEDWDIYSATTKKTGKLLKELIVGSTERDLTQLSVMGQADVISQLIDSHEFAIACKIEDKFILSECQKFEEKVSELEDDENKEKMMRVVGLAELIRKSAEIANKKQDYISAFEKYDAFVKNLGDKVIIKGKWTGKDDGHR